MADATTLEREIRARLSNREYQPLQARLTHAVKAIATMRERLPAPVVEQLVTPLRSALGQLEPHERGNIAWLIQRLCGAHVDEPRIRKVERQLRLVEKMNRQN